MVDAYFADVALDAGTATLDSQGRVLLGGGTKDNQYAVVRFTASQRQPPYRAASIDCIAPAAVGEQVLPAELLGQLPAAPRDLRLEVERLDQSFVPWRNGGVGALIRCSFSAWRNEVDF